MLVGLAASCHYDASSAQSGPEASSFVPVPTASASRATVAGDGGAAEASGAEASHEAPRVTESATTALRRAARRSACEAVAAGAVNSLPEVKTATASAIDDARTSRGRTHFGGVGPIDDPDNGFTVGIGNHTDERFEAAVWYTVDREGHLSVTVLGADEQVGPDVLRRVEQACRP